MQLGGRLGAALASGALAACGAPDDGPDGGIAERAHTYVVDGGTFAELRVDLRSGATMSCTWTAGAALVWEVHAHPLGNLEVYDTGTAAGGTITFTAAASRVHGLQWSNFGDAAVTLDVALELPDDAVLLEW